MLFFKKFDTEVPTLTTPLSFQKSPALNPVEAVGKFGAFMLAFKIIFESIFNVPFVKVKVFEFKLCEKLPPKVKPFVFKILLAFA